MPAAAIAGAAVVGAGATIVAGNKASKAQRKAAETAAASADRASEVNKYIFDTTRADYAPYREVGAGALYKLADMYGVPRSTGKTAAQSFGSPGVSGMFFEGLDGPQGLPADSVSMEPAGEMTAGFDGFQASPGYQFRLQEGLKAIERSAAAKGGLRSGATMKALNRYAQDTASSEYENFANRLAALAGVGQTANAGSAQAGQAYGSQVTQNAGISGQAAIAAGNARASGYANTANAINGGVQNLTAAYLYNQGYGTGGYGGGPGYRPGGGF